MEVSNQQIAKILRNVAAAYVIKKIGNVFQIRAYETAADTIEHSTADIFDLWQEEKLNQVPGLGQGIQSYLDELFKTGSVKHFKDIQKGIPRVVFDLLDIPGVGPKTAQKIAELGVDSLGELEKELKNGNLVKKDFSAKIAQNLLAGLEEFSQRSNRMLLPYAFSLAKVILEYLRASPEVLQVYPLGSLRRMVATVGDLDFAVSSNDPKEVIELFTKMPQVTRILDQGENKASVILKNGIQADLLVGKPDSFGALLQHFTGSKNHNIHLRTIAEKKGLSLSEYGVRSIRHPRSNPHLRGDGSINNKDMDSRFRGNDNNVISTKTEEEFYKLLNMQTPPPELREDTGEIEKAREYKLPSLVEFKDIKGDLHLHSNFPIASPSHGPGADSIEDIIKKATGLGYEFVGVADHPPGFTAVSRQQIVDWVKKRTNFIQNIKSRTKSIRVLNGLEIDILRDGSLSVPDEALVTLDYCIAGIHSGHRGSKEKITQRLIKALENPYVDIIAHPSNRLINQRESSDADWEEIFKVAALNNKLLEINAYPDRLDLRDDLVKTALQFGVKFIINTDAHEVSQMENMKYGVAVARRGWVTKEDVVNCWDWTRFAKWFNI